MPVPTLISNRSIDQLESSLIDRLARLSAYEYQLLVELREYDLRQGWKAWHLNNCAEWLNLKCGLSLGTAREKVRVAHALFDLPHFSRAFERGELSYSKARALTRIAHRFNEKELLEYALTRSASQVEDHCRQLRNANRQASTDDANRLHRGRYLSCTHHADGGSTLSVELTGESAELVMKAIDIAMAADEQDATGHVDEDDGFFAKQADALVQIARHYLAGGSGKATSTADHYQLVVHVDRSALLDQGGKSDLPIESVKRIGCDASLVEITDDEHGNPLDVGRKQRVVPTHLRRALLARDAHCRFPGCTHSKWLDAHHVMHWSEGGETSLGNLMLLCSKHHRLLHEGGYSIEKNYKGEWYFRNAHGRTLPAAPIYKETEYDHTRDELIDSDSTGDASRDACDEADWTDGGTLLSCTTSPATDPPG